MTDTTRKDRAMRALREAEAYLSGIRDEVDGDAKTLLEMLQGKIEKAQAAPSALVLALLADEPCPAVLFAPWASAKRIRQWRDQGKLSVSIKHGRTCVRPSEFFRFFNALPDESRVKDGHTAGSTG